MKKGYEPFEREVGFECPPLLEGRCEATWKGEFKLPWHEAGPPGFEFPTPRERERRETTGSRALRERGRHGSMKEYDPWVIDSGLIGSTDSHSEKGTTRAEDAQRTPTQSHIAPSIVVYEEYGRWGSGGRGRVCCAVWGEVWGVEVWGLALRGLGLGFKVQGLGLGFGNRIQGSRFRVKG